MLLDAILIVLRETLEAGVLVSVLAALGQQRQLPLRWLSSAFAIGITGALLLAFNLRAISDWFDGVGQEVVDAALQYTVYALLLTLLIVWRRDNHVLLRPAMIGTVAMSVIREGSEVFLFFSAYLQTSSEFVRALTSGFVGLMIGVSVGILIYFTLTLTLPPRWSTRVQAFVLPLLAAGMATQATQLLLQADWLPTSAPVWDSSTLLAEDSLPGQLAYAVLGYEATPTIAECATYAGALLLIATAQWLYKRCHRSRADVTH
jgi:high-affinity iron transporter